MARPSDPTARLKLLSAAHAVFVEFGLDRARVEDITRRAGLSKGSFYLHFDSKHQAFRELVEAMLAQIAGFLDSACEPPDEELTLDDVIDQWVNMDVELFELIWQNRGLMGLLLGGGSGAAYHYLVDDFVERAVAKTRALLEAGRERGFYRADFDLDIAADFISGAYDRFARKLVKQSRKPDFRPLVEQLQLLVIGGIGTPELRERLCPPHPNGSESRHADEVASSISQPLTPSHS